MGRWGDGETTRQPDKGRGTREIFQQPPTQRENQLPALVLPSRSTRFTNNQPQRGDARWDARLLEGRFALRYRVALHQSPIFGKPYRESAK
ncbi:MAG: hypothetical protein ACHBN1_34295 [Heteroscytonema crispum UTEX LB 1556]